MTVTKFRATQMAIHSYPPERKCIWPLGMPGTPEFRFCEAPVTEASPYCEDHRKLAYTTQQDDDAP